MGYYGLLYQHSINIRTILTLFSLNSALNAIFFYSHSQKNFDEVQNLNHIICTFTDKYHL